MAGVFTKLPLATAGAFIREVFPWYYLAMGLTIFLVDVLCCCLESGLAQAGPQR